MAVAVSNGSVADRNATPAWSRSSRRVTRSRRLRVSRSPGRPAARRSARPWRPPGLVGGRGGWWWRPRRRRRTGRPGASWAGSRCRRRGGGPGPGSSRAGARHRWSGARRCRPVSPQLAAVVVRAGGLMFHRLTCLSADGPAATRGPGVASAVTACSYCCAVIGVVSTAATVTFGPGCSVWS